MEYFKATKKPGHLLFLSPFINTFYKYLFLAASHSGLAWRFSRLFKIRLPLKSRSKLIQRRLYKRLGRWYLNRFYLYLPETQPCQYFGILQLFQI